MCQLELFERPVEIKLISDLGLKTFYVPPCDTKEFILKQYKKTGLRLYVDGVDTDSKRIEENTVSSAGEIILTRALVGG